MNGKQVQWKPGDKHPDGSVDENHGVGGTYIIKDGKRVLVEGSRTLHEPTVQDEKTGERRVLTAEEKAAAAAAKTEGEE